MKRSPFSPLPRNGKPAKKRRPAPVRLNRTCPALQVARAAGLTVDEICARAAERPLSRDYFYTLCRNGKAPYHMASRLADITGLNPLVFLWGLNTYLDYHHRAGLLDFALD